MQGNNWRERVAFAVSANQKVAIVIGLSAGKDSTAVALVFNQVFPDFPKDQIHYVFADTGLATGSLTRWTERRNFFLSPDLTLPHRAPS